MVVYSETEQIQEVREIQQGITKADFFIATGYYPSSIQAEIHDSEKRFRIVAAGARSGKSMLAGFEAAYYSLFPNQRIWCVSSQYELAEKEFLWALQALERFQLPNGHRIIEFAQVTNAQRGGRSITWPWGSFIKTKSTETAQGLYGEELNLLILCEAAQIPRSVYERILGPRLGPRKGRLLATSTPLFSDNLFADLFRTTQDETQKEDWQGWNFSVLCNPTFPRDEYARAKRDLDSNVFAEQYDGKFVEQFGRVFTLSNFNLIQPNQVPPSANLVVLGLHYKMNNPTAVTFIRIDPNTYNAYIYDEIHELETPRNLFPRIKEKLKGIEYQGIFVNYWDTAIKKELGNEGFITAVNEREKEIGQNSAYLRRIQNLQNRLKPKMSGKFNLQITTNCTQTIEDFQKVVWPKKREKEEQKHEIEMPMTRYLFAPLAASYPLSFIDSVAGIDIYGAQGRALEQQEQEEIGEVRQKWHL